MGIWTFSKCAFHAWTYKRNKEERMRRREVEEGKKKERQEGKEGGREREERKNYTAKQTIKLHACTWGHPYLGGTWPPWVEKEVEWICRVRSQRKDGPDIIVHTWKDPYISLGNEEKKNPKATRKRYFLLFFYSSFPFSFLSVYLGSLIVINSISQRNQVRQELKMLSRFYK